MPINRGSHISALIEEVKHLNPSSVLDMGCGWGLMGNIFRAYTDIRWSEVNQSRYLKNGWQTRIDGIEIFEQYRNLAWEAYNFVYVGDALDRIREMVPYDLIYCGDMIEHLSKEHGHLLIQRSLEKCKYMIVATPYPAPAQHEILGNKHEEHISEWAPEDFAQYHHEVIGSFGGILMVRLWPN